MFDFLKRIGHLVQTTLGISPELFDNVVEGKPEARIKKPPGREPGG